MTVPVASCYIYTIHHFSGGRMTRIEATLCYIFRDEEVLLIYGTKTHAPHYQKWNGVGGKFEPVDGGDPDECCKREVLEETGLTATAVNRLGAILFTGMFPDKELYVHIYTCSAFEGEAKESTDAGPLRWVPTKDLATLPMLEGDQHFLPWVLAGRAFDAVFVSNDRAYVSHTVTFTETTKEG